VKGNGLLLKSFAPHSFDEFVLNQRIPYLIKGAPLPTSPNTETVNQQAAQASRSRSKDETIHLFIDTR